MLLYKEGKVQGALLVRTEYVFIEFWWDYTHFLAIDELFYICSGHDF